MGLILGSAFHKFNSKGKNLVTSVIGALSSPDLFYLLLSFSGVLLCSRNVLKGPIVETSTFTKNVVMFPAETAIEAMRYLASFLLGLIIPLCLYSKELGLVVLSFFCIVLLANFSASILFSFSYKETCPTFINDKEFRILNFLLVVVLSSFFWWEYIRDVT